MPSQRLGRIIWWWPMMPPLPMKILISYKSALPLGIRSAEPVLSLNEGKMHHFYVLERWGSFEKAVGYCFFGPAPRSFIHPDDVLLSVNAATGWELTIQDLLDIGERGTNMARIFNLREGFGRKDDTLPERLFGGSGKWRTGRDALPA